MRFWGKQSCKLNRATHLHQPPHPIYTLVHLDPKKLTDSAGASIDLANYFEFFFPCLMLYGRDDATSLSISTGKSSNGLESAFPSATEDYVRDKKADANIIRIPERLRNCELVIYENLLPVLLTVLKPRDHFRHFSNVISRRLAHRLRLTSFLYGERVASEETASGTANRPWFDAAKRTF